MILFKPYHVDLILSGRKTQTRRLGKRRWNVGAIHQAKTTMFGEPFARLRILDVREQRLIDMSGDDVLAEGYETISDYLAAFCRINNLPATKMVLVEFMRAWIITFGVVKERP